MTLTFPVHDGLAIIRHFKPALPSPHAVEVAAVAHGLDEDQVVTLAQELGESGHFRCGVLR